MENYFGLAIFWACKSGERVGGWRAGHFEGNNVGQQLLPLMLTACRGDAGVTRSPFRASQVSEACLSAPVSTLLTASSVAIFRTPISKLK
jgi:hypothetical protein